MNARLLPIRRLATLVVPLFATLAAAPVAAPAQERYPSRPIEMVVNFGPGGGADQMGRTVARLLERALGVAVPVSNVAGASGNSGLAKVAHATPDGYTVGTLTGLTVSAWAAGVSPMKMDDFGHLAVLQSSPSMLFVTPDSPIQSYRQLLDLAKAKPDSIKVATAGLGTLDDFAVRYLAGKGFRMINAPYAKPGERYTSVLGHHTEVLFEEPGDVRSFLEGRQLVPIVVFGPTRHPAFPNVPASSEFGHAIDLPNWRGLVTSAKVPAERLAILSAALDKVLASDEWKVFCGETYTCIPRMDAAASKKFAQRNYDEAVEFLKVDNLAAR